LIKLPKIRQNASRKGNDLVFNARFGLKASSQCKQKCSCSVFTDNALILSRPNVNQFTSYFSPDTKSPSTPRAVVKYAVGLLC